jgi:regulator of RNase E activity RraA
MSRITLGPLPQAIAPRLISRLLQAEPATIGHFRDAGFMDAGVRAIAGTARRAGTAVTVRCEGLDGSILHHALGQLRPGDFLVVDRAGDDAIACIGGASAVAAALRGAAGIVVDGLVTDVQELREAGIAVWARGLGPRTTRAGGRVGSFCMPVQCGGLTVLPGDAVLADENGILVLPSSEIEDAAHRALDLQHKEIGTLARLRQGESYAQILGTVLHLDTTP